MCTAGFQTHCFQNMCNAVTNSRCGCQRKVYNAERNAQHLRCLCTYQLTHSGDLECSLFNDVCNLIDRSVRILGYGRTYNARSGNTNIDNAIRLTDTMERTSHKRIIFRCITENDQLGRSNTLTICCQLCRFQNNVTHDTNRIHVDTASGGAYVDRRTQTSSYVQCFRNGTNQFQITRTESLVNQCGITADKVDTTGFSCTLQSLGELYRIFLRACSCQHSNRCYSNSLVDDRDTVFLFNLFTGFHQLFCLSCDLVIDLITSLIDVGVNTVQQRNTHPESFGSFPEYLLH